MKKFLLALLKKFLNEPVLILNKEQLVNLLQEHSDEIIERVASKEDMIWGMSFDYDFAEKIFKKQI